tara:strand:+ start:257 stop:574 length:318 start_codon:yes stop_codon:yes gene_type:complete
MIYSVQQTKFDIFLHMREYGDSFERWYVGAASDPKAELAERMRGLEDGTPWLHREMLTGNAVRTVVNYFVNQLKAVGDPVGELNANSARYVIAYRLPVVESVQEG